jgi:hypothetical protein
MSRAILDDLNYIVFLSASSSRLLSLVLVQSLAQRVQAFGCDDSETVRQWKKLCTEYNIHAMKYLQTNDYTNVSALVIRDER